MMYIHHESKAELCMITLFTFYRCDEFVISHSKNGQLIIYRPVIGREVLPVFKITKYTLYLLKISHDINNA